MITFRVTPISEVLFDPVSGFQYWVGSLKWWSGVSLQCQSFHKTPISTPVGDVTKTWQGSVSAMLCNVLIMSLGKNKHQALSWE